MDVRTSARRRPGILSLVPECQQVGRRQHVEQFSPESLSGRSDQFRIGPSGGEGTPSQPEQNTRNALNRVL